MNFVQELQLTLNRAAENPLRFHPADKGFRRANLIRFPYRVWPVWLNALYVHSSMNESGPHPVIRDSGFAEGPLPRGKAVNANALRPLQVASEAI